MRAKTEGRLKLAAAVVLGLVVLALAALITAFLLRDQLSLLYLEGHLEELEDFSLAALEEGEETGRYGLWKVTCRPERGMVEFHTGGSGLGSETAYTGFYYSAEDTHIPFQGAEAPMEIEGDTARWTDSAHSSDNWGTSRRVSPRWFWFEAHF